MYPLAVLAPLAFVGVALAVLRGAPLCRVTLAGGLAVAVYIPLVIPVSAALAWLGLERRREGALTAGGAVVAALTGALPPAVVYGWLRGRDVLGWVGGFAVSGGLEKAKPPGRRPAAALTPHFYILDKRSPHVQ